jgi:predicted metalloprotease
MDWEGQQESSNVEDRRGLGTKVGIAGGGVTILILLAGWFLGFDTSKLADMFGGGDQQQVQQGPQQQTPEDERLKKFSSVIFHSTEVVWKEQFNRMGKQYIEPKLVIYTNRVESGCGNADKSVGPFYCGADDKVYLDLSFFKEMETKLQAPGEFARAYVIAHEVGHHVQHQLGYSARAAEKDREGFDKGHSSVRLELQADYFAGVWAHYAKDTFKINEKDIRTAINAAQQIGDDRLQEKAYGHVFPEKFTHGTSEQRMKWFMRGYEAGSVEKAQALFTMKYSEL